MANKLKRVSSIGELRTLAAGDEGYKKLLECSYSNLGGNKKEATVDEMYRYLCNEATESGSERGVVAEINFCRDLV